MTAPADRTLPGLPAQEHAGIPPVAPAAGLRPGGTGVSRDRSGAWLRNATIGLCVLAGAAASVSFAAQYRMIYAARRLPVVAALEAAIPDAAALIFASLGIALALHGKRAIRARILNVAAVAVSVFMNTIAAAPGWRSVAIWAMPPVAYALASDTVIGVARAWAIARQTALNELLADEELTPMAIVGGLLLWLLRLALAPASTLAGFRAWVIEECPVAPGRRARPGPRASRPGSTPRPVTAVTAGSPGDQQRGARLGTKTARFLDLVASRHGPLEAFPLADVSQVSSELAPEVGLDPGAARSALRRRVLSLRNGSPR